MARVKPRLISRKDVPCNFYYRFACLFCFILFTFASCNRTFINTNFSLSNKERFGSLKSLVLLVVIAILATSNTYAQASFETIGGLRYLIDSDAKTATLAANNGDEKYSGNIVVPEKVKANDGVEYPVTAFGSNAFKDCDGLKSITIPSSVTSLGYCFF